MPFRIPNVNTIIPPGVVEVGGDVIEKITGKKKDNNYPEIWPNAIKTGDQEVYGLSQFMSHIRQRGVAKTNKFVVIFTALPFQIGADEKTPLTSDYSQATPSRERLENISFLTTACETAQFPGTQFMTADYGRYGQQIKMPYMRNFDPVTLSFRVDGDMTEKKFFDIWQSQISNTKTNDFRYKKDYAVQIEIIQLDEQMRRVYGVSLRNAYPSAVSAMDLSYADTNNYHRLNVTFEFDFVQQIGSIDDPRDGSSSGVSATGAKSKTPYDRAKEEILKVGTSIIKEKVIRHIPVGSVPGIGNVSSVSKQIFGIL